MQMNNMAELITVAKYWRQWKSPRWIVGVFNNEDLNQVTWEQRVMEGDPKFNASQRIPNVPYHKFAKLIGLKGIFVDNPDKVGAAWEEALAADRPTVVQFKTDPEVPPLPPHITLKQAKASPRRCSPATPRKAASSWAPPARSLPRSCPANPTSNARKIYGNGHRSAASRLRTRSRPHHWRRDPASQTTSREAHRKVPPRPRITLRQLIG